MLMFQSRKLPPKTLATIFRPSGPLGQPAGGAGHECGTSASLAYVNSFGTERLAVLRGLRQQVVLDREEGCASTRRDADLLVNVLDVGIDRFGRDREVLGHLLDRVATGDQA